MTTIVTALNELLKWELTSIDQYTRNAAFYDDWGYAKLQERIAHEADDERGHAQLLIDRIIFLGGKPNMNDRYEVTNEVDVAAMLASDLTLELNNAKALKKNIALCEAERDFVSRQILVQILKDTEEDHAYWLQQQLRLIETLGLELYLQAQLG